MSNEHPVYFEIVLVESGGPMFRAGAPTLFYWLKSFHLPGGGTHEARATLLVPADQGSWKEQTRAVSQAQAQGVVYFLKKLGIPGRALDVEATPDSSDVWASLLFRVTVDGKTFDLELATQASGFHGRDADQLRALLRGLFGLVGYEDYSRALYGE